MNFYLVLCYGSNIFSLTFRKYKKKKENGDILDDIFLKNKYWAINLI
jgi:hypothetical protein